MNAVAPRRTLAKSLEVIGEFVSADPAAAPVEFVRELARVWKDRGGLLAGKLRHSDRYLDDLLRFQGTPIRSLTPKLVGRTNLREAADVDVLVRLFLSHWKYTGDPHSGTITVPSSDLYEPLLPDAEIEDVCAYVAEQIRNVGAEVRGAAEQASTLPGEDMADLIVKEFREAHSMFVVGAGQTMLVAQPEKALISFRELMDRLWSIEKADQRGRMLIWMLDLGRQWFEDLESRTRFLNVEAVRTRFRALKRFKESVEGVPEARWNWLQSKAVIVLHDTSSRQPAGTSLPAFDPHHVLFSAVPPRWVNLPAFRTLYGDVSKANYTIFLRKERPPEPGGSSESSSSESRQRYVLRYFGNALLGKGHLRGLELIPPGESYTEALGTVFVAAAHFLGLSGIPAEVSIDNLKVSQEQAKEKLQHHGLLLLSLDEFMRF